MFPVTLLGSRIQFFTHGILISIQKISKNYQNSRVSNFCIHKTFNYNRNNLSYLNSTKDNNSSFSQNCSRLSTFKDLFLHINTATKSYKFPIITWFLILEMLITVIHDRAHWKTCPATVVTLYDLRHRLYA